MYAIWLLNDKIKSSKSRKNHKNDVFCSEIFEKKNVVLGALVKRPKESWSFRYAESIWRGSSVQKQHGWSTKNQNAALENGSRRHEPQASKCKDKAWQCHKSFGLMFWKLARDKLLNIAPRSSSPPLPTTLVPPSRKTTPLPHPHTLPLWKSARSQKIRRAFGPERVI